MRWRGDRGQAAPFGAVAVAVGAMAVLGLAELAADAADAARARTAADAAALAGVTGGQGAAERLAAVNHGQLVAWTTGPDGRGGVFVRVTVRVGEASATAAAMGG